MKPVVVSDVLAVGELPTAEQIAILAKAGFRSILNNQPDGEVARFASAAEIEGEARRHGLGYAYAPLTNRTPSKAELASYADAIRTLPTPIYAFCYSGSRSAAGCALLMTENTSVERIIADFAATGFDIEALRPWLEEERADHERAGRKVLPDREAAATVTAGPAGAPVVAGEGQKVDANGSGGGKAHANGGGADADKPATPSMPRMIVVQPRAAGFGGFAM